MKFILKIDLDNPAFIEENGDVSHDEIARLLRDATVGVLEGDEFGELSDTKGRVVGDWVFES